MSAGSVPLGGILVQLNEAIAQRARSKCDPPLDGTEPASELESFDAGAVFGVLMAAESFEIHGGRLLAEFLPEKFTAPNQRTMTDDEAEALRIEHGMLIREDAHELVAWLVERGWRRVAL